MMLDKPGLSKFGEQSPLTKKQFSRKETIKPKAIDYAKQISLQVIEDVSQTSMKIGSSESSSEYEDEMADERDVSNFSLDESIDTSRDPNSRNNYTFHSVRKQGYFGMNTLVDSLEYRPTYSAQCFEDTHLIAIHRKAYDKIIDRIFKKN